MIKKVKNTVPEAHVISDLKGEKIVGIFHEKELKKTNQAEFTIEKAIKRKELKYMSNRKVMVIHLIVRFMKRVS